jgi:hypothetical protein
MPAAGLPKPPIDLASHPSFCHPIDLRDKFPAGSGIVEDFIFLHSKVLNDWYGTDPNISLRNLTEISS